jgi:hypothetical protein
MSKGNGNDRLAAERRRDLLAAGYIEAPPRYPGEVPLWAAPREPLAWRSLAGAWRHMRHRRARPGEER